MRAVAELAAEPFIPDEDTGSQHIINHFNGHRILKRLIASDVERMKDTQQTGKSFTLLSFCIQYIVGLMKYSMVASLTHP